MSGVSSQNIRFIEVENGWYIFGGMEESVIGFWKASHEVGGFKDADGEYVRTEGIDRFCEGRCRLGENYHIVPAMVEEIVCKCGSYDPLYHPGDGYNRNTRVFDGIQEGRRSGGGFERDELNSYSRHLEVSLCCKSKI